MNIEEKITKFTDLSRNDSLSAFMGRTAQQSHNVYQIFYDFISEIKPNRILEIGTALGGFTEFLKIIIEHLNLDTKILSYDITYKPWYNEMVKKGIDVRVENIFNNEWTDVNDFVKNFITSDGITVVLCDGGWKKGEFRILSRIIKTGDFILAHDYSKNEQIFQEEIKDKIWNWCEITEDDITDSVKQNNLESYKPEIFSKAVWVCKIKK